MTWPRWQRLAHDPEPLVARFQRTLVANRQAGQPVKHVLFLDDNATLGGINQSEPEQRPDANAPAAARVRPVPAQPAPIPANALTHAPKATAR